MPTKVIAFPQQISAPGLEWRTRKNGDRVPYWVAPKKAVAAGYLPRTVNLAAEASPALILSACRRLQSEALEFGTRDRAALTTFDGSLGSLIRLYQVDEVSGYRELKWNTRETYTKQLAILDRAVGQRQLHALSATDFKRWYVEFRKPASEDGPERISRAHYLLNLCRMLFKFGVAKEIAECARLRAVLTAMSFKNSAPRKAVLTREMVEAFCREARRVGRPSLALATALQFETGLRQRDVIGEWEPIADAPRAHGAANKQWKTGLRWGEHISLDLILTKATSKSRGEKEVCHDLKLLPLVMAELQYVPPERRIGPVIVSETMRRPYMVDAFVTNWRSIAQAAGIPDNVWNMDARAGAITEARAAGIEYKDQRSMTTHASDRISARYGDRGETLEANRRIALARTTRKT
jgi:hypothetical protein